MMKLILRIVIAAAALAGVAGTGPARAAHPLSTDDAGTLGRRVVQVELGAAASRDRPGEGAREDAGAATVAIGAGLGEAVDLTVGLPLVGARTAGSGAPAEQRGGLGDVTIDLKWRALSAGGFALAVKPGLTVPTGDPRHGLGTGRPCLGAALVASRELGPVSLHANVGYVHDAYARRADRHASRAHRLRASAAAVIQASPRLRLAADGGVERDPDRAEPAWQGRALGAAILAVSERVDLDLGVQVGLTRPATDITALAGFTCRF